MKDKKVLLILSGGLDSTTLLYDLVSTHNKDSIVALSFDYGSKHNNRELQKAIKTCAVLEVDHEIIDLKNIFKNFDSALLKGKIPEGHYAEDNMKKTVVPFRNGILLSIAIGYAESNNIENIYYGAHGGDHAIYPDCRQGFVDTMSLAGQLGTYNNVSINAPYNDITKIDIVKRGIDLKVDYNNTWTCYVGEIHPCGKCGSCVERTEAFIENGLEDPLYNELGWERAKKYYLTVKK